MSKILQQQVNKLQQKRRSNVKDSARKEKSNDFIFKRYRYEQNKMIGTDKQNGKVRQFIDEYQYENQGKENQLQHYKQQLQPQFNHFDIVDFGQDDDQEHPSNQQAKEQHIHHNPFYFDQEPSTPTNHNPSHDGNYPESSTTQPPHPQSSHSQSFQVEPMELVDFQNEEQDQITTTISPTQNIFYQSPLPSDNTTSHSNSNVYPFPTYHSQKSSSSFFKSQISETFMISPDHSLDGGFSLEQSVSNFLKKGKKSTKSPKKNVQKCFLPQNLGYDKYQIHKLSQNENPFKDAIDYSNDEEQLKGIKIHQSPHEDIRVQIFDKDLFVSSKIPPGIILKCKLKRSKGFFSLMNPEFDLYLENGLKHLISARKNLFRNRQLFQLSTELSNFQRPVRTLMANVLHNNYWLVDPPRIIDKKKISYLDLLVEYQPLDEESKKQRQMTVLCPPELKTYHIGLEYNIPYIDFQWFKKNIALKLYFKGRDPNKVKNSEKNFELIDSEDDEDQIKQDTDVEESISNPNEQTGQILSKGQKQENEKYIYHYLKMHKESQNVFDVEIQHPLTPLQAMAIILTRFDAQLK